MALSRVQSMKAPLGISSLCRAAFARRGCRCAGRTGFRDPRRTGAPARRQSLRNGRHGRRRYGRWHGVARRKHAAGQFPLCANCSGVLGGGAPPFQHPSAPRESPPVSEPPAPAPPGETGSKASGGEARQCSQARQRQVPLSALAATACACSLRVPSASWRSRNTDERPQSQGAHEADGQRIADARLAGARRPRTLSRSPCTWRSPDRHRSWRAALQSALDARIDGSGIEPQSRRRRSPCWPRKPTRCPAPDDESTRDR